MENFLKKYKYNLAGFAFCAALACTFYHFLMTAGGEYVLVNGPLVVVFGLLSVKVLFNREYFS